MAKLHDVNARTWRNEFQVWLKYKDEARGTRWAIPFVNSSPVYARQEANQTVISSDLLRIELRDNHGDTLLELLWDKEWTIDQTRAKYGRLMGI